MNKGSLLLAPLIFGIVVTPFAIMAAARSTGAGHGDYRMLLLLFPWSGSIAGQAGRLDCTSMVVAAIQFPLYGLLVSWASSRGQRAAWITAVLIFIGHFAMAASQSR